MFSPFLLPARLRNLFYLVQIRVCLTTVLWKILFHEWVFSPIIQTLVWIKCKFITVTITYWKQFIYFIFQSSTIIALLLSLSVQFEALFLEIHVQISGFDEKELPAIFKCTFHNGRFLQLKDFIFELLLQIRKPFLQCALCIIASLFLVSSWTLDNCQTVHWFSNSDSNFIQHSGNNVLTHLQQWAQTLPRN